MLCVFYRNEKNAWVTAEARFREKLTELNAWIRKKRLKTNYLGIDVKKLEKQQNK